MEPQNPETSAYQRESVRRLLRRVRNLWDTIKRPEGSAIITDKDEAGDLESHFASRSWRQIKPGSDVLATRQALNSMPSDWCIYSLGAYAVYVLQLRLAEFRGGTGFGDVSWMDGISVMRRIASGQYKLTPASPPGIKELVSEILAAVGE